MRLAFIENKTVQRLGGALGLTTGVIYLYTNSDAVGGYTAVLLIFAISFFALGGLK